MSCCFIDMGPFLLILLSLVSFYMKPMKGDDTHRLARLTLVLEMRTNLALNKNTKQTSTLADNIPRWGPQRANDGDRRQFDNIDHNCAHSLLDRTDWWAVDLGQEYHIHSITIYNRADCCGDRLSDYFIYVYRPDATFNIRDGALCYYHKGTSPVILNVACNGAIIGRFVQIFKPYKSREEGRNALSLYEVEVYSDVLPATPLYIPNRKGRFCNDGDKKSLLSLNIQMSGSVASKCSALCIGTDSCLGFDISINGTCSLVRASENVVSTDQVTSYFERC